MAGKKISQGDPDIRKHVSALIELISEGIFEKEHILAMALLCAVAGESIFLLGPPGTAKSLVARRLKMIFKNARSFEYLMSRFSTPDELFGPVSISKLKNEDKYERLTDGYLPEASVVFLDEIWKAGPAIQNTLLTVVNERIYRNGSMTQILPMKILIAASNELPAEEMGLEALWDRFLVRMVSDCIQNERAFFRMIRQDRLPDISIPSEWLISDETYALWQSSISGVHIPEHICGLVSNIRKLLKEEEMKQDCLKTLDFYISDRRWKKAFHLMRASAWLNGRSAIDESDCVLLVHCLWNKAEYINLTSDFVCQSFTYDMEKEMDTLQAKIQKVLKKQSDGKSDSVSQGERTEDFKVVRYFYYQVQNFPKGNCLFAKTDFNHISADKDQNGILYYDNNTQSWIIHAIYTDALFGRKAGMQDAVEKIKIRKCRGGIWINGIPYAFLKQTGKAESENSGGYSEFREKLPAWLEAYDRIRGRYDELYKKMAGCDNLFVSDNDRNRVVQRMKETGKQLEELKVKLDNTRFLL